MNDIIEVKNARSVRYKSSEFMQGIITLNAGVSATILRADNYSPIYVNVHKAHVDIKKGQNHPKPARAFW